MKRVPVLLVCAMITLSLTLTLGCQQKKEEPKEPAKKEAAPAGGYGTQPAKKETAPTGGYGIRRSSPAGGYGTQKEKKGTAPAGGYGK